MLLPWLGFWNADSAPGGKENPLPSWSVRIRIPGFAGATGGDIMFSEAAMPCGSGLPLLVVGTACDVGGVWVPEVVVVVGVGDLDSASGVMVD